MSDLPAGGLVTATAGAPIHGERVTHLCVRVEGQHSSAWFWEAQLKIDPLVQHVLDASLAATAPGCEPAVQLHCNQQHGRCCRALRRVRKGELLLAARALVVLPFGEAGEKELGKRTDDQEHRLVEHMQSLILQAERVGLDRPTLALFTAICRGASGVELDDALGTILSLLSHRDKLSQEEWSVWLRAGELFQTLIPVPERHMGQSMDSGRNAEEIATALLALRANSHAVLDEATATRIVGHGLYPAAAMISHSCAPNGAICFAEDGRMLLVRAMCDIAEGEEICCSYLADAQLYAPWEERKAMLRAAHHFEAKQPATRESAERVANQFLVGSYSDQLAPQLPSMVRNAVDHCAKLLEKGKPSRGPTQVDLQREVHVLRELLHNKLDHVLPPASFLAQDVCSALLRCGQLLEDPGIVARYSLHLLNAREMLLPCGTLHLATLYATHGSALVKLLRCESTRVQREKRATVGKQAAAALQAAKAIRACCLGEEHPLTRTTAEAARVAEQRASAW